MISKAGFRNAGFTLLKNGIQPGPRCCRATTRPKSHSMAVFWLQSSAKATLSTPVIPGFGSCRPGFRELTGYSRICCPWEMNARNDNADAPSWRKAYGLALSLFAVEVVLLYLFTLRFS